jgi:tetratricopeptide (TPR) repeat protein
MTACRTLIARQPNLASGHYYLAMNMAQLARTKLLGALPMLSQMESEWKTALALDDKMDYAGPDRYVGLLYREAPGWPVSLGDAGKARQHLLRAVELSPNFPENYLNLIESYIAWDEPGAARVAAEKLRLLWPSAHKEFVGEYWEESWKDWNRRLEKIEAKLNPRPETPPPPPAKK